MKRYEIAIFLLGFFILSYFFLTYLLAFVGLITLLCIWFKLNLTPAASIKDVPIPTLTIENDEFSKKANLKYSDKINHQIQDIISLILKDYFYWHHEMTNRLDFINNVEFTIIKAIEELADRWKKIDEIDFITEKLLGIYLTHVQTIQKTKEHMNINAESKRSYTHSKEFDYLFATKYADLGSIHRGIQLVNSIIDPSYIRHLLNNVLVYLIPITEYQSIPCKSIVLEVLCTSIIPVINLCSQANFINSFIDMFCQHLLRELRMVKELRRALESNSLDQSDTSKLKSYDDFLQMIQQCDNLLSAKRIRDQIVMEIRRKRLLIADKAPHHVINGVKVKKLIEYTNKLVLAKRRIEQQIVALGGQVPSYNRSQSNPSLQDVLKRPVGLSYFSEYLDQVKAQKVLQLYLALEGLELQLESTDINALMNDFKNLINLYFANALTDFHFPIELENTIRHMLDQLQHSVVDLTSFKSAKSILFDFINSTYYKPFKTSDLWIRMTNETISDNLDELEESELLETDVIEHVEDQLKTIVNDFSELTPVNVNPLSFPVEPVTPSTTNVQLKELNDQLDKLQQHKAILTTLVKQHGKQPVIQPLVDKDNARVLGIDHEPVMSSSRSQFVLKALGSEDERYKVLQKSLQDIQLETEQLQQQKVELENQGRDLSIIPGQIDISIDSYTSSWDGKKEFILYLIRVRNENGNSWNIYKRYSEFLELYDRLKTEYPMLPYELPKKRPNLLYIGQLKEDLANNRQAGLEAYLKNITAHESVCKSSIFKQFLSQDVDNRIVSTPQLILEQSPKKNLKSPKKQKINQTIVGDKVISELVLELFDLQESTFRKHAVSAILNQIFGGFIEKRLLESVDRLLSEDMIVFYLELFKEKLFSQQETSPITTNDGATKIKLELLFPEIFGGFLGRNNSFKAADRVYDSFQYELLNLNLILQLVDAIVLELFPELK